MGSNALAIWINKIDGFIKIDCGIRYLELLDHNWYVEIFDRIGLSYELKSGLIIILEESEFIDIVLYLQKNIDFSCYVLIISVVNKNENDFI